MAGKGKIIIPNRKMKLFLFTSWCLFSSTAAFTVTAPTFERRSARGRMKDLKPLNLEKHSRKHVTESLVRNLSVQLDCFPYILSRKLVPQSTIGGRTMSQKNTQRLMSSGSDTSISFKFPFIDRATANSLVSASAFLLIDVIFRRAFARANISFPSSLGACGFLFATLLALPSNSKLYKFLQPGAALLAKWLPVFFVPSLITLPLADSVGPTTEVLKIGAIIVGGFVVSLLASAYSVVVVRKVLKSSSSSRDKAAVNISPASSATGKAFSDKLFNALLALTAGSGVAAVVTTKRILFSSLADPFTALFFLSSTLISFVFGARLPKKFTKLVHPLVTCTGLTWTIASAFAAITGKTFTYILKTYRKGRIRGINTGAGDVLIFLLGPAVVSLAISMYERRKLMRENLAEVGTSLACSTVFGLFGTALAVRFLGIISPFLRLSLLSRNITSPLAMAIAGILGADVSLAVSFVVVTGLIGANFGASILDACGVKDAVARGLGIGAAAHGLGTAAFANEPDAFPFAAISMALTATAATVAVSIPAVRNLLVQIALG